MPLTFFFLSSTDILWTFMSSTNLSSAIWHARWKKYSTISKNRGFAALGTSFNLSGIWWSEYDLEFRSWTAVEHTLRNVFTSNWEQLCFRGTTPFVMDFRWNIFSEVTGQFWTLTTYKFADVYLKVLTNTYFTLFLFLLLKCLSVTKQPYNAEKTQTKRHYWGSACSQTTPETLTTATDRNYLQPLLPDSVHFLHLPIFLYQCECADIFQTVSTTHETTSRTRVPMPETSHSNDK